MKISNWIAISALLGSISLTEEVNAIQALNEDEQNDIQANEEESSDEDIQEAYDLLQAEVQDLDALAQRVAKKAKKISKKTKKFGPTKKVLTKGQKAIQKKKKLEKKLKALAKKAKKASDTDKLIIQAKQNALFKKQKVAAKKAAVAQFKADKLAAKNVQKKKLLEWKKAKVFGLPLPELPSILKKQVIPMALPPNPKREAKKDEVERRADALIRKLNIEAEAKKEALKASERQAAKEAAAYRLARANKERNEKQQQEDGTAPHTSDEIWAYNMPEGMLKGYFQVGSQALLETEDDEDFEDVDSSDSDDE